MYTFEKIVNIPGSYLYMPGSLCSDRQLYISDTIIQKILRTNNKYT